MSDRTYTGKCINGPLDGQMLESLKQRYKMVFRDQTGKLVDIEYV